jgi:hypothetical protein
MTVQRCPCGNLIEHHVNRRGPQPKWCSNQCRNRGHKKTRTGAAWAQPPRLLQTLADNVATELDQGQLIYHIAGMRSLTNGRLAAILTQDGHHQTAARIQ